VLSLSQEDISHITIQVLVLISGSPPIFPSCSQEFSHSKKLEISVFNSLEVHSISSFTSSSGMSNHPSIASIPSCVVLSHHSELESSLDLVVLESD